MRTAFFAIGLICLASICVAQTDADIDYKTVCLVMQSQASHPHSTEIGTHAHLDAAHFEAMVEHDGFSFRQHAILGVKQLRFDDVEGNKWTAKAMRKLRFYGAIVPKEGADAPFLIGFSMPKEMLADIFVGLTKAGYAHEQTSGWITQEDGKRGQNIPLMTFSGACGRVEARYSLEVFDDYAFLTILKM